MDLGLLSPTWNEFKSPFFWKDILIEFTINFIYLFLGVSLALPFEGRNLGKFIDCIIYIYIAHPLLFR